MADPGVRLLAAARSTAPGPHLEVAASLQQVVDAIVRTLGFQVAVLNLVEEDGDLRVVAVAGPSEMRDLLLGQRQSEASWRLLLVNSEQLGGLRFLDHTHAADAPEDMLMWVPDIPVSDDPAAWHPDDALFAPLVAADGSYLGVLSVDLPSDGRRPQGITLGALEAFAVTASLAVQHAALGERLRRSERQFRTVFAQSPVAIALHGADDRVEAANEAYAGLLHRQVWDLVGRHPREFLPVDKADQAVRGLAVARTGQPRRPVEWLLRREEPELWVRAHVAPLDDGQVLVQLEDITERKEREDRLRHDARHDPLTRLPNRRLLLERVAEGLAAGRGLGVLFCDLDGLKRVNDTLGHAVGDEYLRAVGRRLGLSVRPGDTVGRLSGDEFLVVCPGLADDAEAGVLAQRLLTAVRAPLVVSGAELAPSVSVGVALAGGDTPEELIARADRALYRAKAAGRATWVLDG